MPDRKQKLLEAFRKADKRGLTEAEAKAAAGGNWQRYYGELVDEGYHFREDRSKFNRSEIWRRRLLAEPLVAPGATCEIPPFQIVQLFDPPAAQPLSAVDLERIVVTPPSRLPGLLADLEQQLEAARGHEQRMLAALAEAPTWSGADEREWIEGAAATATEAREAAERRLDEGRDIVAGVEREHAA